MDRCECCDLPVESCGKAAEQRQRAEQRRVSADRLVAVFAGLCADCGERIRPGDTIERSGDGWRGECCL